MRKKEFAIQRILHPDKLTVKGWTHTEELRKVRVMARAEGFAMVRRKGAMPYCASEKDLTSIDVIKAKESK